MPCHASLRASRSSWARLAEVAMAASVASCSKSSGPPGAPGAPAVGRSVSLKPHRRTPALGAFQDLTSEAL